MNKDIYAWQSVTRHYIAVGSRVTCDPAPTDTDEDWIVWDWGDNLPEVLTECGFKIEGTPKFYTGNDNGQFRSWRNGHVNVIVTPDRGFYDLFLTATALARRFNLQHKADRIALFQAILYGVAVDNLEHERGPLHDALHAGQREAE